MNEKSFNFGVKFFWSVQIVHSRNNPLGLHVFVHRNCHRARELRVEQPETQAAAYPNLSASVCAVLIWGVRARIKAGRHKWLPKDNVTVSAVSVDVFFRSNCGFP